MHGLLYAREYGWAATLVNDALTFCRDNDFDEVFLWTVKGLEAAAHLYRTAGFRVMEEKRMNDWGGALAQQRYDLTL